jgi:AcrR family transcriptional regulator
MPARTRRAKEQLKEVRAELYRRHVLEAAERILAEKGIADASMQEIGRSAGVSIGTIYSVFASKDELLRGVLEWRGGEIRELVRAVVSGGEDPREALRALIKQYVEYFTGHPHFLRMHLRLGGAWSLSPTNGKERAAVWEEIHRLQAELMARGVSAGVFVQEDPVLLARLFSAVDQVLLARWVEQGMKASKEELLAQLETWIARLLFSAGEPKNKRRASAHR